MTSLFPEIVQIQTTSSCNARCIICPYYKSSKNNPSGIMDIKLFNKIINECKDYPLKIINLFLMNEPLMDKRLPKLISIIKDKIPTTKVDISTNASLLTEKMSHQLLDSNLDSITLSIHGFDKNEYESIMKGLVFSETISKINKFLEINYNKNNKIRTTINIKNIKNKFYLNKEQIISEFRKKGAFIHEGLLTNRGGNVENFEAITNNYFYAAPVCKRPFGYMGVLFDGKIVACCADYNRENIIGDVSKQTIKEVWNNKLYKHMRNSFNKNDFNDFNLCKLCKINHSLKQKAYI